MCRQSATVCLVKSPVLAGARSYAAIGHWARSGGSGRRHTTPRKRQGVWFELPLPGELFLGRRYYLKANGGWKCGWKVRFTASLYE